MNRFTPANIRGWRETGFTVIERFFTPEEYGPVLADFEQLYGAQPGRREAKVVDPDAPEAHDNQVQQFAHIHTLPYQGSAALNLISLHPQLIAFARALLGVQDVRLYQSHTWAKFTGEADYDQAFHCDYGNHTLLVPAEEVRLRAVDFIFYLTDVTRAHGALRYVPKPDVVEVMGGPALQAPDPDQQAALRAREREVEVPAGSLVAHGIDTMHRGANLTAPRGRRFSMTVGYKAADNDMIAYHVWQASPERPWDKLLNHATPEQLACLGIPRPGERFWTARVLAQTQARWPQWDMAPYFEAAGVSRPS